MWEVLLYLAKHLPQCLLMLWQYHKMSTFQLVIVAIILYIYIGNELMIPKYNFGF